jgi:hypothetical protein
MPKVLAFANTHAIADTGATSIFVMTGTPMTNIHSAMDPLTINLPNGEIVNSTHICDIIISGLPMILTELSRVCQWPHSWAYEFYARRDAKQFLLTGNVT